jgi:hypothetical protein
MFLLLSLLTCALARPQQHENINEQNSTANKDVADNNYRLPTAITPENYNLEIFTHLNDSEGFLFRGFVAITVGKSDL